MALSTTLCCGLFLLTVLCVQAINGYDITVLKPKGKNGGGVKASKKAVKEDLKTLNKMKDCYDQVAAKTGIPASVIAVMASRESRGGRLLEKTGGWNTGCTSYGILQCDKTSGLKCDKFPWNDCRHILMMIQEVLVPFIKQVKKKFPKWTKEQTLQGGIAAYNFGVENVRTWKKLDVGTSGNDYSNDIIARAKCLKALGWN